MPYAHELLDSAVTLHQADPETQANLRRAVSTAYWRDLSRGGKLGRVFDHKNMLVASNRRAAELRNAVSGSVEFHLRTVAYTFVELQERCQSADYDLSTVLSSSEVALETGLVGNAIASWQVIKNEQIAHDYLYSLLFKER